MKTKETKNIKCDFCNEEITAGTEFVKWKFNKTPDLEKSMNEMFKKDSVDLHNKCSIRLGTRLIEDGVKGSEGLNEYAKILFKSRIGLIKG